MGNSSALDEELRERVAFSVLFILNLENHIRCLPPATPVVLNWHTLTKFLFRFAGAEQHRPSSVSAQRRKRH